MFDLELEKTTSENETEGSTEDTVPKETENNDAVGEPNRTPHSSDLSDANELEKEKRRKRKLRSRRRRLASLGRTRTRKSREDVRAYRPDKGKERINGPQAEAEEATEREKRIERLELDLNLALPVEERGDGNGKGVKYLQRFLFKKRRRHSDGYAIPA